MSKEREAAAAVSEPARTTTRDETRDRLSAGARDRGRECTDKVRLSARDKHRTM